MQILELKAFRRLKNLKGVVQKMVNLGKKQRKKKRRKKRNPKKKRNTRGKATMMTIYLQRRAKTRKEGIIMKNLIQRSMILRLLHTQEKGKLIMIPNLKRILNISDMTLSLRVNHLMKKKNNPEGVMTRLISTYQAHQNTEPGWMMNDHDKEDNGMTLIEVYGNKSIYYDEHMHQTT